MGRMVVYLYLFHFQIKNFGAVKMQMDSIMIFQKV